VGSRPWDPERTIDEALAATLVAAQFPNLAPLEIAAFGHGWDNAAFLVNGALVFRFPRRAVAVPLIERESRILPTIAPALPVCIPAPRFIGRPQGAYPWPFHGYPLLAGTTACAQPPQPSQTAQLAAQLGDFLHALHGLDPAQLAERGLSGDEIGRLDHARRLPLATERFAQLVRARLVDDAAPFLDFMHRTAPRADEQGPHAVLHGDLYARHLLLDEHGRLGAVIDWGDMHLGHRAIDLSVAHLMLPSAAHRAFVTHYGAVDDRTWQLARYRAIYHAALVAAYGRDVGDRTLLHAGLRSLEYIRESLDERS
jgi:aminoglycoside phosphotransferase (APT) family kinase protein